MMDYAFAHMRGFGSLPSRDQAFPALELREVGLGREPESAPREPEGVGRAPTGLGDAITQTLKKVPACPGGWAQVYPSDPNNLSPFTAGTLSGVLYTLQKYWAAPATYGTPILSDGFMYFRYASNTAGGGFGPQNNLMRFHMNGPQPVIGICLATVPTVPAPVPSPAPVPLPIVTGPLPGPGPGTGGPVQVAPGPASLTWLGYAWVIGGDPNTPPSVIPPGIPPTASGVIGTWVWRPAINVQGGGVIAAWMWYPPDGVLTQLNGVWIVAFPGQVGNPTVTVPAAPPPGLTGSYVQAHAAYFAFVPTPGVAPGTAPLAPPAAPATDYTWAWILGGVVVVGGVAFFLLD